MLGSHGFITTTCHFRIHTGGPDAHLALLEARRSGEKADQYEESHWHHEHW